MNVKDLSTLNPQVSTKQARKLVKAVASLGARPRISALNFNIFKSRSNPKLPAEQPPDFRQQRGVAFDAHMLDGGANDRQSVSSSHTDGQQDGGYTNIDSQLCGTDDPTPGAGNWKFSRHEYDEVLDEGQVH